jgi:hypothetical protein
MRVWTVHTPPEAAATGRGAALLPERFSSGAFLFGPLWLLFHRLWWEAAGLVGAELILGFLLPPWALPPAALAIALLLGLHGQDLRRAALARRGWRLAEVVAAPDEERALARLLDARPELAGPLVRAA